jgi:hypothetical protein
MGQEIVYCSRCQIRLTGSDFDRGEAVRCGNRVACRKCAAEVLASLPPEEQESKGGSRVRKSTGKIPIVRPARPPPAPRPAGRAKDPEPSPGHRNVWIVGGVAGSVVLVIVLAALMGRSPGPAPPSEPAPVPYLAPRPRNSPPDRDDGPHREVRRAIEAVKRLLKEQPADVESPVVAAEEAARKAAGTPLARDADELREAVLVRRQNAYAEELSKSEREAGEEEARGEFGRAAAILEAARKVRSSAQWGAKVEAAISGLRRRESERTGGLVGWWKLDGTGSDSTSRARSGTVRGNVQWGEGRNRRAARFPDAGEVLVTPFAFSSKSVTLAAWVRHESLDDHIQRYVSLGDETAVIRHENRNQRVHFYIRTGGQLRHLYVEGALDRENWRHVAGTWDGTTQRLYVDGVLRASATPPGALGEADRLAIGSGVEPMHGWLQDVRVYDRALSEDEVREVCGPPAAERPWRALFDGSTLEVLNAQSHPGWKVEGGAIVRSGNDAAQSAQEFGDGEIRFRFEGTGLDSCFFKVRQGGEGGMTVSWNTNSFLPLAGKPHDLIFTLGVDRVSATLDGSPVEVVAEGKPRGGRFQFNAKGAQFRVLSIDLR